MRRFAGCCRFVWNRSLALEIENYEKTGKRLGYKVLAGLLVQWKQDEQTKFLSEIHSQVLQQSLKDLHKAYQNLFAQRAEFPNFKKKGSHCSFRYPQGFKIDEANSRVYLPKIGWMRYRNSRKIEGEAKNITVSYAAGRWFVSIQTGRECAASVHPSTSSVGIDIGVAKFATLSDGTVIESLNSFRKHEKKLAKLQRKLAKKQKFSSNWEKLKLCVQRMHRKIANVRNDFLHKASNAISKNHAVVVLEDLQIDNMSKSAKGTAESPRRNVKAKSGLNKSILDQGWGEFKRQLGYKLFWAGGRVITVPPQYTSQTCSRCGCVRKENRKTQALFRCVACGYETMRTLTPR